MVSAEDHRGVGSLRWGHVPKAAAERGIFLDLRGIGRETDTGWRFAVSCGTGLFGNSYLILPDDFLAAVGYGAKTPVIDGQTHQLCVRIVFRELDHDAGIRAAEAVNTLIVISYHEQICRRAGQQTDSIELLPIDILEFIDEEKGKALLPQVPYLGMILQQQDTFCNDVIKIQKRILTKILLVIP